MSRWKPDSHRYLSNWRSRRIFKTLIKEENRRLDKQVTLDQLNELSYGYICTPMLCSAMGRCPICTPGDPEFDGRGNVVE